MLAGFIVFAIMAFILVGVSKVWPTIIDEGKRNETDFTVAKRWVFRVGATFAIVSLLFVAGDSITIIKAGEGGVITRLGATTDRDVTPGPVFTIPFIETVHIYDTKLQKIEFTDLEAASKELQALKITGVLNYRLNPDAIPWLFQNVGSQKDLEQKFLIPSMIDSLKTELPDWAIETILANRGPIANDVVLELIADNASFVNSDGELVVFFTASEGGVVEIVCAQEDVVIEILIEQDDGSFVSTLGTEQREICGPKGEVLHLENIGFSAKFDEAIENRQAKLIEIQTARNVLITRQVEADQARATAAGVADANRAIAASLEQRGAQIVQLAAIDALGDNVEVILLPANIDGLIPLIGSVGGGVGQ